MIPPPSIGSRLQVVGPVALSGSRRTEERKPALSAGRLLRQRACRSTLSGTETGLLGQAEMAGRRVPFLFLSLL